MAAAETFIPTMLSMQCFVTLGQIAVLPLGAGRHSSARLLVCVVYPHLHERDVGQDKMSRATRRLL